MKTLYVVTHYYKPRIERVEAVRETNACFWTENGRRHVKSTADKQTFETFDAAKAYAIGVAEQRVQSAKRSLAEREEQLSDVQNLSELFL